MPNVFQNAKNTVFIEEKSIGDCIFKGREWVKLTVFQRLNFEHLYWWLKLQQFIKFVKVEIKVEISTVYATFTLSYSNLSQRFPNCRHNLHKNLGNSTVIEGTIPCQEVACFCQNLDVIQKVCLSF